MGFLSKTYDRYRTGDGRLEGDLSNPIEEFFKNQPGVKKYEIVDKDNWIVDVDGSIELYEDDLYNGELFFKIGKLSGDLLSHPPRLKSSVLPLELGGEIIFVREEEDKPTSASKDLDEEEKEFGMGLISSKPLTQSKAYQNLKTALGDCISNGYDDFNIEELIADIKKEWENINNWELTVDITPVGSANNKIVNFYIGDRLVNLTAIEKALYIFFILKKEGMILTENDAIRREIKHIYSQIKGRVQDDYNGITSNHLKEQTLVGYRSGIRKAIKEVVPFSKIVDEYAIEGKNKEGNFYVRKASDELRDKLKKYFFN
ncbi:MAG: hypothetical protein J1E16_00625 [Muribaculaceae bacterium]|nr:hypothetical protein [Muribaculaceae bacterium]